MSRVETTPVGVCTCSRDKTSFEKSVVATGDIADGRMVDSATLGCVNGVESDTPLGVIYIYCYLSSTDNWLELALSTLSYLNINCFNVILVISSQVAPMLLHL